MNARMGLSGGKPELRFEGGLGLWAMINIHLYLFNVSSGTIDSCGLRTWANF